MRVARLAGLFSLFLVLPCFVLKSADNLVLNPNLDYSDHNKRQGLLITGDNMEDGLAKGKVNYVLFFFEKCYNAKRQARVTVRMYEKYKDRIHFVIVDLDRPLSPLQMKLARQYLLRSGDIPHTTILDKNGKLVFDYTGEADEATMSGWVDHAMRVSAESDRTTLADQQATPENSAKSSSSSSSRP